MTTIDRDRIKFLADFLDSDDATLAASELATHSLALLDALAEAEARVQAVRELHRNGPCSEGCHPDVACLACGEDWPCPTIRALDGTTDGSRDQPCRRGPCCLGDGHDGDCRPG